VTCPVSVIRRAKPQVARARRTDNGQLAALGPVLGLALVLVLSVALTGCGAAPAPSPRPTATLTATPTASATAFSKPKATPQPLTLPRGGRTLFPRYRLVGYVGAPASPALGRLGVGNLDARAREIERRLKPYAKDRQFMPVLELIATLVHPRPGRDGKYRQRTTDEVIGRYLAAARRVKGLLLLNIQPGRADFLPEVKAYERWLREPDVGLALDPEWAVGPGQVPGRVFGSTSGKELDQVARYLAGIVQRYGLPEKALVFHQLHASIVKDQAALRPHRGVALIKSVDGIGHRADKEATWRKLTRGLPRHIHTGFKLFFTEDRRHGPLMTPQQVLALRPTPVYVMYE
jgi:hypothetical protein